MAKIWFCCCRYKITRAGAGRSHSVVVTEDGYSLSFGWNKHGQLGSGSIKNGRFSSKIFYYRTTDID